MSERVLEVVIGRVPPWSAATLPGYRRRALGNGRCYPGVCRAAGAAVRGRLLRGISPAELARMDRFEGDEYAAVVVPDVRLDGGQSVRARLWVLESMEGVEDGEWSFESFLENDEGWYVEMCREWSEDDKREQQQCTPQRRGGD